MQVGLPNGGGVLVFDVATLGSALFDASGPPKLLRRLLEDPLTEKLTFDCRDCSEALFRQVCAAATPAASKKASKKNQLDLVLPLPRCVFAYHSEGLVTL